MVQGGWQKREENCIEMRALGWKEGNPKIIFFMYIWLMLQHHYPYLSSQIKKASELEE